MARSFLRILTAAGPLALAGAALAQPSAAPVAAEPTPVRAGEPKVEHQVSEDDNVRIEETRVRGQTQSITVHSKTAGVKPYQVIPSSAARDPSQPGDAAGQRVWNVLKF